VKYYIDGELIRFSAENASGLFHKDYVCQEQIAYLAWVADGNTADEWQPEIGVEN
jgi:hypothetical protein